MIGRMEFGIKGIWDRICLYDSIVLQDGDLMLDRRCAVDKVSF